MIKGKYRLEIAKEVDEKESFCSRSICEPKGYRLPKEFRPLASFDVSPEEVIIILSEVTRNRKYD